MGVYSPQVERVAEALWRHHYHAIAYEIAADCGCGPEDYCPCPEPTEAEMAKAWAEVRVMYPPDLEEARVAFQAATEF